MAKQLKRLILCLALPLGVGYVSSIFTQSSIADWYLQLIHPVGTPPAQAFRVVWTLLYVMMGLSLWSASQAQTAKQAYALFYLQLFFNLLWSFLFFGMQSILLGLIDILLIDVTLAATIWSFWRYSKIAALLLVPYFLWVLYATYLNISLFFLN
jgi:benzodiazapine receptor